MLSVLVEQSANSLDLLSRLVGQTKSSLKKEGVEKRRVKAMGKEADRYDEGLAHQLSFSL